MNVDFCLIILREQLRSHLVPLDCLAGVQQALGIDLKYALVQVLHSMLHRLVKMLTRKFHIVVKDQSKILCRATL